MDAGLWDIWALDEIRQLFFGFRNGTPASKRWRKLSRRKLTELKSQLERIKTTQHLLRRMTQCCRCDTLDECGKGIFRKAFTNVAVKPLAKVLSRRAFPTVSTASQKSPKVKLVLSECPCCYLRAMRVAFLEWALHPRRDRLRRRAKNCPTSLASRRAQLSPKESLCAGSSWAPRKAGGAKPLRRDGHGPSTG
jgi:MerR, DNA binding